MKRNPYLSILHTALAALFLAAAASCSDDDPSDAPVPGTDGNSPDATNLVTVRFASGDDATPETRTTIDDDGVTVKWKTSDNIGISAVCTDTPDGTTETNKKYNPANATANSAFNPDGGKEMQLDDNGTYTFYSYYPWKDGSTADKVTGVSVSDMTQTDGTTSDHIGDYDFMWAREENVLISGTESPQVSFNYQHIFPMLVFSLDNAEGKEVKCISVRSADGTPLVQGTVEVSLADGKIEQVTSGKYYTSLTFTTPMDATGTGRLLILPQAKDAKLIVGVLTTDNVLYEYTKTAAADLEGGKSYGFKFDLADGDVDGRTVYAAAGTNNDWQIANESGLRGFALAVHYYGQANANAILTDDITLSAYATWEEPIGIANVSYSGTFNGDGHTVSGLAIDRTSSDNVGLFGYLNNAKVSNLRVTGSVIAEASQYVGGIAGQVVGSNAVIENCLFAGTVTGSLNVGGIAGQNSGSKITACFSSGSVTAKSSTGGGIVGCNDGATIIHCYSSAEVTAETNYAGGIVGTNNSGSKVTTCYATGRVSAKSYAGGIAGSNSGIDASIEKCLALGTEIARSSGDAEKTFGRIAGESTNGGTIINCAAYSGMIVIESSLIPDSDGTTGDDIHGAGLTQGDCIINGHQSSLGIYAPRGFTTDNWGFSDALTWDYLPWLKVLDDMWPTTSATDHPARIALPAHLTPPPTQQGD